MRRHRRFEFFVGEYLKHLGYEVEVTQGVADWGIDAFGVKDGMKYAVQAKMYGDCKTRVNRRMMMELFGAMHFFECQGAIMIYNGRIMTDALQVAEKLGIQVVYLDQHEMDGTYSDDLLSPLDEVFEKIWNEICQLEGRQIENCRGTLYQILRVTDGDITYTNQSGKRHKEPVDLFRRIVGRILQHGYVEQSQLRGEFSTLASAFIATVFANIPSCSVTSNPTTITIKSEQR